MSDSSDEDVGPMPASLTGSAEAASVEAARRKRAKFNAAQERIYLNQLPCTELYEQSYMHRDVLTYTLVTKTEFIITASVDGHLKFWKTTADGIEFVKHFRAHLDEICGISANSQGTLLATISPSKELKIFDVTNFDMINMVSLPFVPSTVTWAFETTSPFSMLAVSDADSGDIHMFDGKGDGSILHTVKLHKHPVAVMNYNARFNTVISIDASGMMEYWSPDPPAFTLPTRGIDFAYKSDTDLFEFKRNKNSVPSSLEFSPNGHLFVTYGLSDRTVRVWKFATGKLMRKYDESLQVISEMQQAGTAITRLDDMEFGRRMAIERELEASVQARRYVNAVFDISSEFVLYPTLLGIKIVHVGASRVSALVGGAETLRVLHLALYQGAPKKKKVQTLQMAASENPALQEAGLVDPILVATAFKKNRFFLFTRREPAEMTGAAVDASAVGRDHFNEKPTKEEQSVATLKTAKAQLASSAVIHTTLGDITIKLFPDHTPKTVENWVGHARGNYYCNHLFHRVIKDFMVQTGCPKGDGTGGESIWGGEFEDEIVAELRHDRPGIVSMANAGPASNGSQFFITTAAAPWLDGKHTVFGRVEKGMDVVHAIEQVQVDKNDRPLKDIKIVNITCKMLS
ncbi:peptidyl-prolyl cis-trans isomerase cyp15 [Catenaria anguillulae PL171]|uniref:peptidylprolyl isomerase n=1 Tax=Catenaria anguillulae PL171 TaxID=765915 RepID=A0A1Y2I040_9FUNG|nr:peptidyl-prolyl cis-trans isomerase cyp15 [Catenaria anguillulae PL171]